MSLDQETRQRLDALIASDEVVLFMKGNRSFPQCGFSATVVQILNTLVPTYTTVNVLSDAAIRQGIKEFSEWPTIPQLYVRGEFIGGCDIVREMFESGELRTLLGAAKVEPPTIHLTDAAAKALGAALAGAGSGDCIHLAIDAGFNHSLEIGPRTDPAIEVTEKGVTIVVEPMSVQRASGLTIDFVESESGFKMDNPNRPPEVTQLSPSELEAKLASGEIAELIDVRTQGEHDIAHIKGSRLLDEETMQRLTQIDVNTPVAFYCHHGHRSLAAAEHFRDRGFRKVYNLAGGIDAWSREVDASVKRY
jgi:monothiol glutaredoxin